ncbi:MAG: glutamate synthase central domain-containing protein, partial [Candidatus Poribacteria bacterium]
MRNYGFPKKHGLYNPAYEHDSCGVGFIAHIKGRRSHQIILDANEILCHMDHRGARGAEENTGDGAGVLTALPHDFLKRVAEEELKVDLPAPGQFAAGVVFLPTDEVERQFCKETVEKIIVEQGQKFVGWRKVPVNPDEADIGPSARAVQPVIEQLFVAANDELDSEAFERQLYVIRKRASHELRIHSGLQQAIMFYVCSLSTKVIVYKGQLFSSQLMVYYPDLVAPDFESHLAMVHSRFSTNTFPSWDRAHPNRFMCHNGEINTLRGNTNWMHARHGVMKSELFGDDLRKLFPIIEPDCSDSGNFDNALELLLMAGRSLPEAVMMMIPEAWENQESISPAKRGFYEFHSCLQEPWDGPASIAFTDGKHIGAVLDRNGLRPSRYYVTHDDFVIMASEVGVLQIPPENVKIKGRLQPGRMFLVDFEQGRLIPDDELKHDIATQKPYQRWLDNQRIQLSELPRAEPSEHYKTDELLTRMQAFGYTVETLQFMLKGIVEAEKDPIGSMGNDAALACLSDNPRLPYDYFKQLFAQVTNPAIDSIREEIIMTLQCFLGPEGNPLETTEAQCHRLAVPQPILTNEELAAIKQLDYRGWRSKVIDITYPKAEGVMGLEPTLKRICEEATTAIEEGHQLIVLSDRSMGPGRVPISSLLATGAVHHHLVRTESRTRIGIVVESGEAREVHHLCLLVGYGADAINPYIAFEALYQLNRDGAFEKHIPNDQLLESYITGVCKGMLKVMSKMGISTLASYKGAQVFEAVGLNNDVIEQCFAGTISQ